MCKFACTSFHFIKKCVYSSTYLFSWLFHNSVNLIYRLKNLIYRKTVLFSNSPDFCQFMWWHMWIMTSYSQCVCKRRTMPRLDALFGQCFISVCFKFCETDTTLQWINGEILHFMLSGAFCTDQLSWCIVIWLSCNILTCTKSLHHDIISIVSNVSCIVSWGTLWFPPLILHL